MEPADDEDDVEWCFRAARFLRRFPEFESALRGGDAGGEDIGAG